MIYVTFDQIKAVRPWIWDKMRSEPEAVIGQLEDVLLGNEVPTPLARAVVEAFKESPIGPGLGRRSLISKIHLDADPNGSASYVIENIDGVKPRHANDDLFQAADFGEDLGLREPGQVCESMICVDDLELGFRDPRNPVYRMFRIHKDRYAIVPSHLLS